MMFKKTLVKIVLLAGVSCFFLSIIAVSVWGGDLEASNAGMMAEKNGDPNRAIKLYTQAINSEDLPQKELALIVYLRGNLFLARSEYNRAIEDASKAIKLDPTGKAVAYAYHIRAGALSGIGQFDRAIKDHNKSIELKPEYANAYYSRALSWLKKGDKELALADFTKAIDLKPQYAAAYHDRGNVWMEKGDSDRALSDYNKAIELDSRYTLAYYSRGNFYIKKGAYDLAIKDSKKAVALNPEDSEAYANIGTAWLMKKSYRNAISNFTKAIQLNPNYADAYFNRCIAYAKSNQANASLRDAKRFIQIAPNHPRASIMQEIVKKSELKVSNKTLKGNEKIIIIKSIGFGLLSTILLFFIIACLFMYAIFALWQITIVCGPAPENGRFHTQIELKVNWKVNRPPILYYGLLPFLVECNLLFYWIASILGIILVYLNTSSLFSSILAACFFLVGSFVSLRMLKLIVLIRIRKHWRG